MQLKHHLLNIFFFISGGLVAFAIVITFSYILFTTIYKDRVYPGVKIDGILVEGKTRQEVESVFPQINFDETELFFVNPEASASAKGKDIDLIYDKKLMSQRAYSIGRQTNNPYYNLLQIVSAWRGQIDLPIETRFSNEKLTEVLIPMTKIINKEPVDAIFEFVPNIGADKKGRVRAFLPSKDGQKIDIESLQKEIANVSIKKTTEPFWQFNIKTKTVYPVIQSSTADAMGIKDLLGKGESYFYDSIPGRLYNIGLATQKVHGSLIAPNEIFSFSESIGTVSAVFGYKKAYAIKEGKTVLDDGGGVCQVSTTLYRAALNSGLPIVERVPHSYRVGFYEQGGFKPGMDATVYPPSPDLKIKNDTGQWILVQTLFDEENHKLTIELFGTNDGREVKIMGPIITGTIPAPEPIYEDDPTLPAGEVKQTDTAHSGANTYFTRLVTRNGETLINEKVVSNYIPWPARFLRGTKSN